jgi:hypothetical protein
VEWAEGKDYWHAVVNTVISSRKNPVRKRTLGRSGCRWKDNIKMDIRKWNGRRVRTTGALL